MSFLEAMQWRYTAKKYNSAEKLDSVYIEELKEVLRLAPSSINSQPWRFSFVSDAELKKTLAEASLFNAPKVLDCHTIVVFSRIDSIEAFEKQITTHLPEGAVAYYNQFLKQLPESELKAWFDKQVYLALGVLLGACAEMRIDATPMEGIEAAKYNTILGNEEHHALVAVAIGYRHEEDANQPNKNPKRRIPLDEVVQSI